MIVFYMLLSIFAAVIILTAVEIIVLCLRKPAQELPDSEDTEYYSGFSDSRRFEDLYLFLTDEKSAPPFNKNEIYSMLLIQCEYMNNRFDCADFRAQLLFKIYKDCEDKLNTACKELIKKTFLGFKYFMDEPGDDSMCYWSENHQIMFAVAEYLAGQQWQDEIFTNDNLCGKAHKEKAKLRIDAWMSQRFDYGFSEYLSNNYLAEDISPMANFIAYADDKQAVIQMKIIMDILWLDVALNSVNNRFVATSPRMYGNNKLGNYYGNSIQAAMNVLWGKDRVADIISNTALSDKEKNEIMLSFEKKPNYIVLCFTDIVKKGIYVLPDAIKDVALTKKDFISKISCGLSPEDLQKEKLIGQQPYQIMAQLGAEAFTNPEVIENTLSYIKNNRMYRNSFVGYFKFLNLFILRRMNWRKFAAVNNVMPHGIATGRGNVYTYRTAHYLLTTSVCKEVDMCGAQEHIWNADISETLTLFTTHPAGNANGMYGSSPGYWIGNGRRPMSVQHKNVNITIYKLPSKRRIGEFAISDITHAYMPKEFYDEFEHNGNIVLARKNGVFVALISNGEMKYKPYNKASANGLYKGKAFSEQLTLTKEFDLCRTDGAYHIYITELSDVDKETFSEFKERIKKSAVKFTDAGEAEYVNGNDSIAVSYDGAFTINGRIAEKEFDRYDSVFCKAKRKPDCISVNSGNNTLLLDFNNCIRKIG